MNNKSPVDTSKIDKMHRELECRLLNLMLREPDIVDEITNGNITAEFFTERHQPLAQRLSRP